MILQFQLCVSAALFAAGAHDIHKQVRKYSGEPYVEHCFDVEEILVRNIKHVPLEVRAAALLHDVLEDVPEVSKEVLGIIFGPVVTDYVLEVTNPSKPSDGNRATRKLIDKQHLLKASFWGATIKYADLISNTKDIVKFDKDFARVYLKEKRDLLTDLYQGSSELRQLAIDSLKKGWKEIYNEELEM